MPTNSSQLAEAVLGALHRADVSFAVLHGEAQLVAGTQDHDIDLVVSRPWHRIIDAVQADLRDRGVHLVCVWPYDVNAASTFWCDVEASAGAQVDLLCDVAGAGRYGLRTAALLASSGAGMRWPVLAPLDRLLYVARKRQVKGDRDAMASALLRAYQLDAGGFEARASRVLTPAAFGELVSASAVPVRRSPSTSAMSATRHAKRYARRAVRPAGYWVDLAGVHSESHAAEVVGRFRRILVHARLCDDTGMRGWCRDIAPVRWRPGLAVSVGSQGPFPPDLRVETAGLEAGHVARAVVLGMEQRALRSRRGIPTC